VSSTGFYLYVLRNIFYIAVKQYSSMAWFLTQATKKALAKSEKLEFAYNVMHN